MNQDGYYNPELAVDIYAVDEYQMNAYVARVFGWMFFGLLVTTLTTAGIVFGIYQSAAFAEFIASALNLILLVFVFEFIIVGYLSVRVHQMHPTTAKVLYTLYAMLNGFTFGLLVFILGQYYIGMATIGIAFGISAASFGIMAMYGLTTRRDLTRFGNLLFMGLFGVLIAGVATWFMRSTFLDFVVMAGGLVIFLGLVAYHTFRIKNCYAQVVLNGSNPDGSLTWEEEAFASNLAIHGALSLYLAFINIFLRVIMILARMKGGGGRR